MVGGADLLGLPALCQGGFLAHVARPRVPTCPVPPDANGSTRALVVPDLPVLTSGRSLSGITRRCDHSSCARDLRSVGPATMINLRVIALRVLNYAALRRCAIPPGPWTTSLGEDSTGTYRKDGQVRALITVPNTFLSAH